MTPQDEEMLAAMENDLANDPTMDDETRALVQ
jgi:hypothetical protein